MSKKSLIWLAALGLAFHLTACTSNEEKADVEGADVEALSDGATDADGALTSDALPEEALGGDQAANGEAPSEGLSLDDSAATPTIEPEHPAEVAGNETPALEPNTVTDTPPPASSEIAPSTSDGMIAAETHEEEKPVQEKPKPAPLQKIATAPWKVGKTWYNGVYFARPGDTLASISQTIYGEDRTAMLKKGNPSYKSREPKPGDKVYYSSVKRPDDSTQMLTFNEEAGVMPETYVAKKGDNIRKVSKELLGYDNAWKEVWASNMGVESKGSLDEGTELRYWRGTAAAAAPVAQHNMEQQSPPLPEPTMNNMPPEHQAQTELPPMPEHQAAADLPPPPPMPEQAVNELPPPPPPPVEMAPPPPPPPPAPRAQAKNKSEEEATGMNEDSLMALGAVAIAAAGIAALLVARRRRKQKELEASQIGDSTQVGT